jgi:hypothetical protein
MHERKKARKKEGMDGDPVKSSTRGSQSDHSTKSARYTFITKNFSSSPKIYSKIFLGFFLLKWGIKECADGSDAVFPWLSAPDTCIVSSETHRRQAGRKGEEEARCR